jgi:hypothetical protein
VLRCSEYCSLVQYIVDTRPLMGWPRRAFYPASDQSWQGSAKDKEHSSILWVIFDWRAQQEVPPIAEMPAHRSEMTRMGWTGRAPAPNDPQSRLGGFEARGEHTMPCTSSVAKDLYGTALFCIKIIKPSVP